MPPSFPLLLMGSTMVWDENLGNDVLPALWLDWTWLSRTRISWDSSRSCWAWVLDDADQCTNPPAPSRQGVLETSAFCYLVSTRWRQDKHWSLCSWWVWFKFYFPILSTVHSPVFCVILFFKKPQNLYLSRGLEFLNCTSCSFCSAFGFRLHFIFGVGYKGASMSAREENVHFSRDSFPPVAAHAASPRALEDFLSYFSGSWGRRQGEEEGDRNAVYEPIQYLPHLISHTGNLRLKHL